MRDCLKKGTPVLLLAIMLGSLILAGCGSDSDDETATLSKSEYIKQADKICKQTEARQVKLVNARDKDFKQAPGASPEEALIEYAAIPTLNRQAKELAALPEPAKEAAKAKAFLNAFQKGLRETEEDPKSLLNSATNPFLEAEELAVDFGFKVCAGP